jgi:hypothetical protein
VLRSAVIAIGALALIGGLVGLLSGAFPPAFVFAFWGALIVIFTVYERVIYKPVEPAPPGAGFVATSERFLDDVTGKQVTVYVDPASGERRYVQG